MTLIVDPKRGTICLADLEPVRGLELQKTRPVVVLSSDAIRSLPVRCLSVERFLSRHGSLPKTIVAEIAEAVSYCLEE